MGKRKAECTPEEWARVLEQARETQRLWRAANPEKLRERYRRQRAANPEKLRETGRKTAEKRRQLHREKLLEQNRKWRAANLNKARAACRKSYQKNPEKARKRRRGEIEGLADCYVAETLRLPLADCTPELIEMKREQLMLKRLTKQLETVIKEKKQ